MSQVYVFPPSSSPSDGAIGASIPLDASLAGAENPSGKLEPLMVDSGGNLLVTGSFTPTGTGNVNLIQVGGAAITLGQKLMATSLPVTLASDQSALAITAASLPLPTGASTSALQTTGNTSLSSIDSKTPALGQALAAGSVPVVLTAAQLSTLTPLTSVSVTQGTSPWVVTSSGTSTVTQGTSPWVDNISQFGGSNVVTGTGASGAGIPRVTVSSDSFPATQPVSGTVTANQGTSPWVENLSQVGGSSFSLGQQLAAASLPIVLTAAQLTTLTPLSTVAVTQSTSPWVDNISQFGGSNVVTGVGNSGSGIPRVTISSDSNLTNISGTISLPTGAATSANQTNGTQKSQAATPTAGTITQAAITVGTTAVRLTVSGSAPSSTRSVLVATPDNASVANFFIGSSSVTNSGANRGIEIVAGQTFVANSDAGDYYIISSSAAQTVYVMEQA